MSAEDLPTSEKDYLRPEDRADLQRLLGDVRYGTNSAVQRWANGVIHRIVSPSGQGWECVTCVGAGSINDNPCPDCVVNPPAGGEG